MSSRQTRVALERQHQRSLLRSAFVAVAGVALLALFGMTARDVATPQPIPTAQIEYRAYRTERVHTTVVIVIATITPDPMSYYPPVRPTKPPYVRPTVGTWSIGSEGDQTKAFP